jgi:uncharacterized membrane protein YjgN (DUF898 family)
MALPSTDRGANAADSEQHARVAPAGMRPDDSAEQRYPVEFTAGAGEYFRIWIVNLALTIVTLGIYSAWAKVRKRRYFYGHTRIAGEGFEYRANPIAILKGRIIAVAALAVFYGVGHFWPLYQWILWIPFAIIGPWLLVRSLAFNAFNSAHRNVRFGFRGTCGGCMKVVLVYGWLVLFGILYPYFKYRLIRFIAENHWYGTTRFEVADFKKPFISAYANAFGLGLALMVAIFGLGFLMVQGKAPLLFFVMAVLIYGGVFMLFVYIRARTTNAIWNAVRIGPLRFESALGAQNLMWLYFSNLLAIAFTLGLATPWAVVRAMRYRASKTTAIASGNLDGFAQAEAQQVSVAGEEAAELFDIDIAL